MRRARSTLAHAVLIAVGLLLLAYPFTLGADPGVSCRGQEMQAGDTCPKADGESSQTYEQRARDARNARPVIFGVGLGLSAFGIVLVQEERRRRLTAVADESRQ